MSLAASPAVIALDWGTSSLRASLMDRDGHVLERRARPWGIQHLPEGGFVAALHGIAGDWRDRWPALPVVAAGMVGSRGGWREVPYVRCPADPAAIAAGLVAFDGGCGTLHLVPGLIQEGGLPDVMRGEETQILGALATDPALADGSLLVLPGTHSKWARVEAERIVGFTTYLTGELFALLREHSLLGRPARDAGAAPAAATDVTPDEWSPDAAFQRGLRTARESGAAGIAGRIFSARSLFLTGGLSATQTLDYLSGLLVGEEIRSVLAGLGAGGCPPLVLLGDPALCRRYRAALAAFDIGQVRSLDDTGPAGVWRIARAAGLVA